MHDVTLPADFRAALAERRGGRPRVFEHIDPRRTALLVIDMQDVFVAPGALLEVPAARGIVANINRLAVALRERGALVVWLRSTFGDEGRARWDAYFDNFAPAADRERLRRALYVDGPGHAFWHELEMDGGDLVIDKDRFSPFAEGASSLEVHLRRRGIDTLIVTGTLTNVCCESTTRDAMMRDYRCLMIEDANAALSDEDHLAALKNVARTFGEVLTTAELLDRLEAPRR